MSNTGPYSDHNLQILRITDFSPGIYRHGRGILPANYALNAPLGSAATTYACIFKEGFGLTPLPRPIAAMTYTSTTNNALVQLGNQFALSGIGVDSLVSHYLDNGDSTYRLGRADIPTPATSAITPTVIFSNALPAAGLSQWTFFDSGVFQDPSTQGYRRVAITTDPTNYNWITISDWHSPATGTVPAYATGSLPTPSVATPRIFYHANRIGVLHAPPGVNDASGFSGAGGDLLDVSNLLVPTFGNAPGLYYSELGNTYGTWGSISTGELFLLYSGGGAVLLYGDMFAPSQTIKLPGVVGTGTCFGKAALSSIGLVYSSDNDGAYAWNGDNTSNKISTQIPDDNLYRPLPPANYVNSGLRSSNVAWGPWIMFPRNYLYDTLTSSWWTLANPSLYQLDVNTTSFVSTRYAYSTPGWAQSGLASPTQLTTYQFDRYNLSYTWLWQSNPLPVTQDALVSIQLIEIVASNPSSSACTITVLPQVPSGQTPLQQQSQSQPLTFTIPPSTTAYRASQRLGYTDYNIQLSVTATNSNTSQSAPILHEISIGYTTTRPAGIQ